MAYPDQDEWRSEVGRLTEAERVDATAETRRAAGLFGYDAPERQDA